MTPNLPQMWPFSTFPSLEKVSKETHSETQANITSPSDYASSVFGTWIDTKSYNSTSIGALLLLDLAKHYNFKISYRQPLDLQYGVIGEDGTFNGIIGEIIRKQARLGMSGITMIPERWLEIQFTELPVSDPLIAMVTRQHVTSRLNNGTALLFIFTLPVWALLVGEC